MHIFCFHIPNHPAEVNGLVQDYCLACLPDEHKGMVQWRTHARPKQLERVLSFLGEHQACKGQGAGELCPSSENLLVQTTPEIMLDPVALERGPVTLAYLREQLAYIRAEVLRESIINSDGSYELNSNNLTTSRQHAEAMLSRLDCYFQFTLETETVHPERFVLMQFARKLRAWEYTPARNSAAHTSVGRKARCLPASTVCFLCGNGRHEIPPRMGPANFCSIVFGLEGADLKKPIAYWLVVYQHAIERFRCLLPTLLNKSWDDFIAGPMMSEGEYKKMRAKLAQEGVDGIAFFPQLHGHTVRLPPGCVYSVPNSQPNIMLAFDYAEYELLPLYVQAENARRRLFSRPADDFFMLECSWSMQCRALLTHGCML